MCVDRVKRRLRRAAYLSMIVVVAAVVAGCGGTTSASEGGKQAASSGNGSTEVGPGVSSSEIKLTSSTGLSGDFAVVTGPYVQAAQSYFAYVNAHGGVYGRKVVWKPADNGFEIQRAVSYAQKVVSENQDLAAVLPFGTATTLAAQKVYEGAKVPFVSLGSTTQETTNAPYTYGCSVPYSIQASVAIATVMHEDSSIKKVGTLLYAETAGGEIEKAVTETVQADGGTITKNITFEPGTTEFSGEIQALRSSGAQAVVLYGSTPDSARAVQAARRAGFNAVFVGPQPMADPEFIRLAGAAAEGVYAGSPFYPLSANTAGIKEYKEILKKYAPDQEQAKEGTWSLEGYDCAKVVVQALKGAGKDLNRSSFVKGLQSVNNFATGISAPVSLSASDHMGSNKAMVVKVKGDKFVQVTGFEESGK